jgi:hypothetical protein
MAFHYRSDAEARAAIYDAALLLLEADHAIGVLDLPTVQRLSDVCHRIANEQPVSRSSLVSV